MIGILGCGSRIVEKPFVITEYKTLVDCGRPKDLHLKPYNVNYHIGHKVNQEIEDYNLISIMSYVSEMQSIIVCYEVQTIDENLVKEKASNEQNEIENN